MSRFKTPKTPYYKRKSFIPKPGELIYDNDEKTPYIGNGITPGGVKIATTYHVDDNPPRPTDDITKGYTVGDMWLNVETGTEYVLIEDSTENAVWHQSAKFFITITEPTTWFISVSGNPEAMGITAEKPTTIESAFLRLKKIMVDSETTPLLTLFFLRGEYATKLPLEFFTLQDFDIKLTSIDWDGISAEPFVTFTNDLYLQLPKNCTIENIKIDGDIYTYSSTPTLINSVVTGGVIEKANGNAVDNSIVLNSDVTWYVAADGDADADGLTVDTPITLEEAASRVYRVVPTDNFFKITIELADGVYDYANDYTFRHPSVEYGFTLVLHGQDWVGVNTYPTANISGKRITFENFIQSWCGCENIYFLQVIFRDSYGDLSNIATGFETRLEGHTGYAYVANYYKFASDAFLDTAFTIDSGYLDLDNVTFDDGGTSKTITDAFVRIQNGGTLNLYSACTTVGSFTGKRINFISPDCKIDTFYGGEEYLDSIPGNQPIVYPSWLVEPSNTLATTASLGTAAALDVGTSANNVLQLDSEGKIPAVDGSALLNLPGGGGGGHTIQDEGIPLTQRTNLNFVGSAVTVTDDSENNASVVTINVPSVGGINWQGAWDNATAYVADDAVEYNGSSYIANTGNTNKVPGVDIEWDLWVEKGDTGATGSVSSATGLTLDLVSEPATPDPDKLVIWANALDGLIYTKDENGVVSIVGNKTLTTTTVKTANYTAIDGDKIPCDTITIGAFTITTPASGCFQVIDVFGNTPTTGFGVNNLTIFPASGTIMGEATLVLDVGGISPEFELIGTDWRIINHG
jgi:hypothetical protein